ncbi:MAG TPA: NnrS family protein, partial [Stellaceae bacterium]|nr:NnrS family protein [Stellaceae bacterium]
RTFFLLAPLYGALAIALWVPAFLGWFAPPLAVSSSLLHAHEMIFGFAGAALAGFFLTAVPNWTGAKALHGAPLAGLAVVWLAGRVAMAAIGPMPPPLAAIIDLAFLPMLALAVIGPLLASGKKRNLVLLVPLALFWSADAAMQAQFIGWTADTAARGARAGIDILLLFVTVIGGRIVPTFTANALRAAGDTAVPRSLPALDRATIGAMALLVIAEAATGMSVETGAVAALACVLNAARLALWRGERTLKAPILWVLHLGYLWLVVGLGLKAAAALGNAVPESAALHALALGAAGTMIFAVMSRAALGHTGRALKVHPAITLAYLLVSLASVARIVVSFAADTFILMLGLSGLAWIAAALLFLGVYAPILILRAKPGA